MKTDHNTINVSKIEGPSWNLSTEYSSLDAPEIKQDLDLFLENMEEIKFLCQQIEPYLEKVNHLSLEEINQASQLTQKTSVLYNKHVQTIHDIITFANCVWSVDGKNEKAKALKQKCQNLASDLHEILSPYQLFLMRAPDALITKHLSIPQTEKESYAIGHNRLQAKKLLSLEEEKLITNLSKNGIKAWGDLYTTLSSQLLCEFSPPETGIPEKIGVTKLSLYISNSDESVRKAAWIARNKAWETVLESCASSLNAITGWRLDLYKKRSHTIPVDFLDDALHDCHIQRSTLDAMLNAVNDQVEVGRKASRLRAKALGKSVLSPWDIAAPPPSLKGFQKAKNLMPFEDAIHEIKSAFNSINPEMANFAEQAVTKGWIEGSVNDSKRPGGYCTTFLRSRTSRIYTTYQGTLRDVETVAHELGHAFHNWAMKDMDLLELEYPMTLAETASILAETVLNEHLAVTAKDRAAVFDTAWNDAISAEAFLVSIPARFEIEKELCIRRKNGPLSVAELKALTNEAFKKYYGDSLTEFPTLSWAQTLHFYITGTTFYNFPYTFGYLFSLGVYAQKEKLGKNFYPAYLALLRDTGRMSAEDVAQKHLGVDISKPDFWVEAIKIVENKVNHFENLVTELI